MGTVGGRRRVAIAAALMAVVLVALLGAWFATGWHDVRAREAAIEDAPVVAAAARAGQLARELRGELDQLVEREASRPYFHYQNLFHDPRAPGESVTPSPLATGPEDPLILGYFQIDADARVTTPSINDQFPQLSEAKHLVEHRAFREAVALQLAQQLAPPRGVLVAQVDTKPQAPPHHVPRSVTPPPPGAGSGSAEMATTQAIESPNTTQTYQIDPNAYTQNSNANAVYSHQTNLPEVGNAYGNNIGNDVGNAPGGNRTTNIGGNAPDGNRNGANQSTTNIGGNAPGGSRTGATTNVGGNQTDGNGKTNGGNQTGSNSAGNQGANTGTTNSGANPGRSNVGGNPTGTTNAGTTNTGTTNTGSTNIDATNAGTTNAGTTNAGTTNAGTTNAGTTNGTTNAGTTNAGRSNVGGNQSGATNTGATTAGANQTGRASVGDQTGANSAGNQTGANTGAMNTGTGTTNPGRSNVGGNQSGPATGATNGGARTGTTGMTTASSPATPRPVTITVSSLEWHTLPFGGSSSLVAVREVQTPDGNLAQGFIVDRAAMTSWLADHAGDLVAELHPRADTGSQSVELVPGWELTVQPNPREVASSISEAASVATAFIVRFLIVGAIALLAAMLVVWLVARAERYARERSQFAAAAAHELRTPLAGLQLYGDMLSDGLGDPAKLRDYARRMSEEASRLGRVVSNVLGFSQLERGNLSIDPKLGNVAAALRDLVEHVQPTFDRAGAAIDLDVPELLDARFDRDALARIVGNLLDNAEKYTREAEDRTVHLTAKRAGEWIEIAVRDHGTGVAAPAKLFQAFARGVSTDGPAGLGLGLALSRSLATAMGGELVYREGDGATFVLRIPVA